MENHEFPNMVPVKSAPPLFSIYGCGFRMYGRRDEHEETGSHLSTHFLTAFFIPVIALGVYRIIDADDGKYYFLGKEKLSGFEKKFNCIALCLIIALIGGLKVRSWLNSDSYIAGQNMEKAAVAMAENRIGEAVVSYKLVLSSETEYSADAERQIEKIISIESLKSIEILEALKAVETAARIPKFQSVLYENTLELLEMHADSDPRIAKRMLFAVSEFAPDQSVVEEKKLLLLGKLAEKEPDDYRHAVELALLYESKNDLKTCESLLTPHESKIGGTEGARILGQIYAYQNKIHESYNLLLPYTQAKLRAFHAREKGYNRTLDDLWKKVIDDLNDGKGPKSFYDEYERANEARKNQLLQEYYRKQVKKSRKVASELKHYQEAAKIVPVALDMGIVILRRAQGLADEAERTRELEMARETFLAIKGVAGESEQYRLYLAQVYYWLGKPEEGRELFDKLLADKNRDFNTLYSVSSMLRDVGEESESKKLALEAYEKAGGDKERYRAAGFLAVLTGSLKEKIEWLYKADPEDDHVRADLSKARGDEATRLNKMKDAVEFYDKAIGIYNMLPKSSVTLNNVALVYFNKYGVTGDKKTLETGIAKIDEAIALNPGQSIILMNASQRLISAACDDIIGDRIDLSLLKMSGNTEHFAFLYDDEKQKKEIASEFIAHPAIVKALSYIEKSILLAPKNSMPFAYANLIYSFVENEKGLSFLENKLRDSSPDLESEIAEHAEVLLGANDDYARETNIAGMNEYKELLARINPEKDKTTHAVLVSNIISIKTHLAYLGDPIDYNELVSLAEKNYKRLPSDATRSALISSLLSRSLEDLSKKTPGIMELRTKYRRSFSDRYLTAIALDYPELENPILANRDFKRAADLLKRQATVLPADCNATDWAILRHSSPELAREVSRTIVNNPLYEMELAIMKKLRPYQENVVYERYWKELLQGRDQDGIRLVREAIDSGMNIPMPSAARKS